LCPRLPISTLFPYTTLFRSPVAGLDHLQLAVDVDVLDLIDQDHRGIAIDRDVAGRDLHGEPLVGTVAELLHELARLGAIRLNIRSEEHTSELQSPDHLVCRL